MQLNNLIKNNKKKLESVEGLVLVEEKLHLEVTKDRSQDPVFL